MKWKRLNKKQPKIGQKVIWRSFKIDGTEPETAISAAKAAAYFFIIILPSYS